MHIFFVLLNSKVHLLCNFMVHFYILNILYLCMIMFIIAYLNLKSINNLKFILINIILNGFLFQYL